MTSSQVFFVVALAAFCYAALAFLAEDWGVFFAVWGIPPGIWGAMLSLAATNYLLRFLRWQVYLGALDVRVGWWRSLQIFLCGFSMTISPGKAGEAIKAYLLRKQGGHPWSKGLAVVFSERLTDLVGVFVLVVASMSVLPAGREIVLAGGILLGVALMLVYVPRVGTLAIGCVQKVPLVGRKADGVAQLYEHTRDLFSWRNLALGVALSCAAWFAEGLTIYVAVKGTGGSLQVMKSVFVYSIATLAGAISALPGGLVATEGSMAGLLMAFGVSRYQGAVVIFVIRLCTLWFAVGLGVGFLLLVRRAHALSGKLPHQVPNV